MLFRPVVRRKRRERARKVRSAAKTEQRYRGEHGSIITCYSSRMLQQFPLIAYEKHPAFAQYAPENLHCDEEAIGRAMKALDESKAPQAVDAHLASIKAEILEG